MNELNTVVLTDPLDKFEGVHGSKLIAACGYLLPWAVNGISTLEENLLNKYEFFYGWNKPDCPTKITDEGVYSYPQDPDLSPLVTITRGTETMHIYQYGIVAVRAGITLPYRHSRMD
jgi:hypothetical protein